MVPPRVTPTLCLWVVPICSKSVWQLPHQALMPLLYALWLVGVSPLELASFVATGGGLVKG